MAWLDPDDVRRQLEARLSSLPYDEYLDCVAAFLPHLDDEDRLLQACGAVPWELSDEARSAAVDSLVEGVMRSVEPGDDLADVRPALGILDRARVHAAPVLDEPVMRRAGPDDVATVLGLLDEAVAWLRGRGSRQWLLWPRERDMVAACVFRGEVWLLDTASGAAGTVTLTAKPDPGRWDDQRDVNATHLSRLVVRRDHAGRGIGGQILRWARIRAYRHGDFFVRIAAWPTSSRLHEYLSGQGFRYLTHEAGPLATSRALFMCRALTGGAPAPFADEVPPVLLATHREDREPHEAGDHEHVVPQLRLESGDAARLMPGHRHRLWNAGGWKLQGAEVRQWHPGEPVTAVDGLELRPGTEYVLTHLPGDPCAVEVVAIVRGML
ncbi:hypothetical protein [Dactylosporangium sp. NPDC005555]|uniref:hypothetical protein n=1 Tax=Dactylosporangium sp. NPDC005555 TaxID=3154889 RepID=UPI0033B2E6A0